MPFTFSHLDHPLPRDHSYPEIERLSIPDQFFWVRAGRPPLAGMQLPTKVIPWDELHRHGFRWIACLCSEHPLYDPLVRRGGGATVEAIIQSIASSPRATRSLLLVGFAPLWAPEDFKKKFDGNHTGGKVFLRLPAKPHEQERN